MTNAEAWFNIALGPRKPEGSLGWTAQDGHLDSHTTPELSKSNYTNLHTDIPHALKIHTWCPEVLETQNDQDGFLKSQTEFAFWNCTIVDLSILIIHIFWKTLTPLNGQAVRFTTICRLKSTRHSYLVNIQKTDISFNSFK